MSQIVFKEKLLNFLLKERQATMQHMPPQSYLQLHVPLAWILPQCLSARTSAVITLWVSDHHTVVMKSSGELLSLLIDYISSRQLQWSSTRTDIPWIHKHQIHSIPSKSSFHSTSTFLPGIIQCLHRNLLLCESQSDRHGLTSIAIFSSTAFAASPAPCLPRTMHTEVLSCHTLPSI